MNSYKVVHSHVFYNSGFIAFLSKIFGVKKVIVHSHSTRDNKNINSFFRKIYRFSSKFLIKKFADKKLACGELAGKYLYGKSDFKIINNGIDSNRFINFNPLIVDKIKKQYNIKSNDMVIGHIGRLTEVKNHDFILKLASSLTRENDNIKFLLIGDGELKDSIEKKIKDEKIKNIVMVGNVFDIPEYLQCMSLIIMPSLYEGFPVTLVESQMSGLPFIASTNISKEVDLKVSNNVFLDLDVDLKNVTKELKKIYMEE